MAPMLRWRMMLVLPGRSNRRMVLHMLRVLVPLLRILRRIRWHGRPHLWMVVLVALLRPHVWRHGRVRHIMASMTTRHGHLPIRHARRMIHPRFRRGSVCLNVWTTLARGRRRIGLGGDSEALKSLEDDSWSAYGELGVLDLKKRSHASSAAVGG